MVRAFVRLVVVAASVAGLVASNAASTTVPKVTLTVVVDGAGVVVSKPAGIHCPSTCKVRLRKGARVVLAATPGTGEAFSGWGRPCGTAQSCALTVSKSESVLAYFDVKFVPPPPPPPPPAKPGHYTGTYTDGTNIAFDVDSAGANVYNIQFDLNGHCGDGGTSYGNLYGIGPFTIHTDGSFTGKTNITFPAGNGTATADVAGTFAQSGAASGTIQVDLAFTDGVSCTSTGTWTAKLQS